MKKRCDWVTDSKIYIDYHDKEWGVPVHDDRKLFEMLLLEGAQAGLSWLIILQRRETYRLAYDGFDPYKIATWGSAKLKQLLNDPGIIRNKLKIEAARLNAQAYLKAVEDDGRFSEFIWSFVAGKPIRNAWESLSEIPASTNESAALSKELKKRGFKFVGPTICYAFMQAVGMVNDHLITCFRYKEINSL
jgi:DNA-3-methyladenine glycosylase I